jgi:hypothetical protein
VGQGDQVLRRQNLLTRVTCSTFRNACYAISLVPSSTSQPRDHVFLRRLNCTTCFSGSKACPIVVHHAEHPIEFRRRAKSSLLPREISATRARMNVAHGSLIPAPRI